MLGRVAVVFLIFLSALPALPQCNYSPVRSAQFRSSALDLAIDGNDVWVATSYGVSLYDARVDPPRLLAAVVVPGTTRIVRVQNGIAYAGSGNSLVVIQKSGARSLQVVRSIDAGAPVNDIVATPTHLYVATTTGLAQYDLLSATNPTKTAASFSTSRATVTSLTLISTTLYAADGDSSIEAFNIASPSNPQLAGRINAPSAISVVRAANNRLYGSQAALSTFIYTGSGASMTNVATAPVGTVSLAPLSGDIVFVAGNDRQLRAFDFTAPLNLVEVFRADLPPTSGTINRIAAMAVAGNRLYVAGGDMGLSTYDLTGFVAPFAVHAYASGGGNSIVSLGDKVYVARSSGGIMEFAQSTGGALTQTRSWDTAHVDSVWDGASGLLLSSTGASATLWALNSSTPQVVVTANFRAPIASAVLIGTVAYAVLTDHTIWSADFAQAAPAPVQITIAGTANEVARSVSSLVFSTTREDGNTTLSYFATPQFNDAPRTVNVPGASVTRVILSNSTAAVLTFQGVVLVNMISGFTTVLPQSVGLARALAMSGNALFELLDTSLVVWDTQTRTVVNRYTIPGEPLALHAAPNSTIADIATSTGIATVAANATSRAPAAIAAPNANAYYKKVVAGNGRIGLFDGRDVDIYNETLRFVTSLPDVADVAADDNGIYTVSSALVVTSRTSDGVSRGTAKINEGADAQPLSIRTMGGALWVSLIRGCSAFACEKKTIVFDPRNGVAQTATFTGGIIDAVISGTRAYAATDLPSQIRVINISDPFHPSAILTAAAPSGVQAIAYANGTVYVLGDKLTAYSESTLIALGDILGSYVADPAGTVTPADQRLRIEGTCAVVTGRSFAPLLFTINAPTTWIASSSFSMPSATRSIAGSAGTIHFLTDHSLETWSNKAAPKPPRRETAR